MRILAILHRGKAFVWAVLNKGTLTSVTFSFSIIPSTRKRVTFRSLIIANERSLVNVFLSILQSEIPVNRKALLFP